MPATPGEYAVHPLWPVVLILGEIALRVARRQAEENTAPVQPGGGGRDDEA